MTTTPLPAHLVVGGHARRDLLAAGLRRAELDGPLWTTVDRGVRTWGAADGSARARLLQALPLVPPGAAVGTWAAAIMHGAQAVDAETADGERLPVVICGSRQQTCRRRLAARIWRSDLAPDDLLVVDRIPVTSPVRTGFDLARLDHRTVTAGQGRESLDIAVALVDQLLATGRVTRDEIAGYAVAHPRRAGRRQVLAVLDLCQDGSRSMQESRFRLLWTLDARLPRPVANCPVLRPSGELLAVADLLLPEAGLIGEYDGLHHADAERRTADLVRAERLTAAGLRVVRVTAHDLTRHRSRTVWRLREQYRRGLERDRSQDAWTIAA